MSATITKTQDEAPHFNTHIDSTAHFQKAVESNKPLLNIVIVGHVNHGKSTLMGRLLYESGTIPPHRVAQVKEICEKQAQNITIDTIRTQFETKERAVCIIDAPSHREFLKNMISGAANASTAILMVDVDEGIKEHTKGHANILAHLGIQNVVVAVNKMDLVNYSEERFNSVKKDIISYLKNLDVTPFKVIPVSAREGQNVRNKADKMPWNKEPSFLELLDIVPLKEVSPSSNLRIPIQDVMRLNDDERIYMGHVASGKVTVGDIIKIQPHGRSTQVTKLYHANKEVNEVTMGSPAGVVVTDKIFADRGDVIILDDEKSEPSRQIITSVFWFDKSQLKVNHQLTMKVSTATTIARVVAIKNKLNSSTLRMTQGNSEFIDEGDTAELVLSLESPIFVDNHSHVVETGRIILQRSARIVGGGIIKVAREPLETINTKKSKDTHTRTLAKTLTWRIIATLITMIVTYVVTGSLKDATVVGSIDTVLKLVFYYFHERAWDNSDLGRHHDEKQKEE